MKNIVNDQRKNLPRIASPHVRQAIYRSDAHIIQLARKTTSSFGPITDILVQAAIAGKADIVPHRSVGCAYGV